MVRQRKAASVWCATTALFWVTVAVLPQTVWATEAPSTAAKSPQNRALTGQRVRTNPHITGSDSLLGKVLVAVRYDGLHKTVRKVVDRELLIEVGTVLRRSALRETVIRLRNLGVFRIVTAHLAPSGPGVMVRLQFDEKWTLLPVFSWGRGGDRLFLAAGAQDTHVGGRLFDVQALYTLFAGTHSISARFDDPRLFDRRFHLSVFAEAANRNRYLYDDLGVLDGTYSRHRNRLSTTVWDRRNPLLVWSVNAQLIDDTYDESLLDTELRGLNQSSGFGPPAAQRFVALNAGVRIGRLDLDDYVVSGRYVSLNVGAGVGARDSSTSFIGASAQTHWAWALPYRQNVVVRARVAATTATAPEFQQYVGGLWYVRGFFEGRFSGPLMWVTNAEYRVPSIHTRLLVLQHVFFTDIGDAGRDFGHFARRPGIAFGTGGRVILPMVANFVARLDIAWFVEPVRTFDAANDWRISFGSQQHF